MRPGSGPHVTALTINRPAQREVGAMIDRVVGNKLLPANIRQDIIERTDGIPLFVEEMTKAVLEAESEGDARRTVATVPSVALAVPASLHAALLERLAAEQHTRLRYFCSPQHTDSAPHPLRSSAP